MSVVLLALLLPLAPAGAAEREAAPAEGSTAAELRAGIARGRELRDELQALAEELRPTLAQIEADSRPYSAAPDMKALYAQRGEIAARIDSGYKRYIALMKEFGPLWRHLELTQAAFMFGGHSSHMSASGITSLSSALAEFGRFDAEIGALNGRITTLNDRDYERFVAERDRRLARDRRRKWAPAAACLAVLVLGGYVWRRRGASRISLPGYRIERRVRSARWGVMYEAVDLDLNRRVAVREVSPQVAEAADVMEHPDLGKIYAVLREAGRAYLVYELPKGKATPGA